MLELICYISMIYNTLHHIPYDKYLVKRLWIIGKDKNQSRPDAPAPPLQGNKNDTGKAASLVSNLFLLSPKMLQCLLSSNQTTCHIFYFLYLAFSSSDKARQRVPNSLPTSPNVKSGLSSLSLGRISLAKSMYPERGFLALGEPLALVACCVVCMCVSRVV